MVTFIFLSCEVTEFGNKYSVGVLGESEVNLMTINDVSPEALKDLIDSIPTKCIFVGKNLRSGVLQPLMIDLCKLSLGLPKGLIIHWVPPYNLNFDDINWLYNYGIFTESNFELGSMCESVGLEVTGNELLDMANLYFSLVGDFRTINLNNK